jgi:hypothetical protein
MIKKLKYSLGVQYGTIKSRYPEFISTLTKSGLTIKGQIRPTARSKTYTFKLKYIIGGTPDVSIITPALKKNFKGEDIPHTYPKEKLCLYYPGYKEFTSSMLISDTVIPWISLWLYHYENWHLTGDWMGGGIHPK